MAAVSPLDPSRFFTADPRGGALLDRNGDGFPDGLRARLVVDGKPAPEEWVELIHLAARLGLETGGLDLPLAMPEGQAGELPADTLQIVFHPADSGASSRAPSAHPVLSGAAAVGQLWRQGLD